MSSIQHQDRLEDPKWLKLKALHPLLMLSQNPLLISGCCKHLTRPQIWLFCSLNHAPIYIVKVGAWFTTKKNVFSLSPLQYTHQCHNGVRTRSWICFVVSGILWPRGVIINYLLFLGLSFPICQTRGQEGCSEIQL